MNKEETKVWESIFLSLVILKKAVSMEWCSQNSD